MTDISQRIEHSLLKADTATSDVRRLCDEAVRFRLGGVCIPPFHVREARNILGEESAIKVVTVVGFPMGYSAIAAKSEEIKRATDEGADEIDAVVNIAAVKSEAWTHVRNEIDSLLRATQMRGRTLKLILECGLLNEVELERLCNMAIEFAVPFVKTGTGMNGSPVTPELVARLRSMLPASIRIKAAGGIRNRQQAEALFRAGADRIGTSASLEMIKTE